MQFAHICATTDPITPKLASSLNNDSLDEKRTNKKATISVLLGIQSVKHGWEEGRECDLSSDSARRLKSA